MRVDESPGTPEGPPVTAHGLINGHPASWDGEEWHYDDTGVIASGEQDRPCQHCGLAPVPVSMVIPADLSHTGEDRVTVKLVDACIAELVRKLNAGATLPVTRASCCGHGAKDPEIMMADYSTLVLRPAPQRGA